jgi:hypothetical protein
LQNLISEGRARENSEKEAVVLARQKSWYRLGSIVLIVFTLSATAYTFFYYMRLTVPVEKSASVGVFPSTEPIATTPGDVRSVLENLKSKNLEEGKPYLVTLVPDINSQVLLTPTELLSFFESKPSEPFINSFSILRWGSVKVDGGNIPFIIGSVKDAEISTKEFLIAEKSLLQNIYQPLGIDLSKYNQEIGEGFVGEYIFNIPARSLRHNSSEGVSELVLLYAKVTDDIVVFTTSPNALKAIYENIIRQQI